MLLLTPHLSNPSHTPSGRCSHTFICDPSANSSAPWPDAVILWMCPSPFPITLTKTAIMFSLHPTTSHPFLPLYLHISLFIYSQIISSYHLVVSWRPASISSSLPDFYSRSNSISSNSLLSHYLLSQYIFYYSLSLTHTTSLSISSHSISISSSIAYFSIYYSSLSRSHSISLSIITPTHRHTLFIFSPLYCQTGDKQ